MRVSNHAAKRSGKFILAETVPPSSSVAHLVGEEWMWNEREVDSAVAKNLGEDHGTQFRGQSPEERRCQLLVGHRLQRLQRLQRAPGVGIGGDASHGVAIPIRESGKNKVGIHGLL